MNTTINLVFPGDLRRGYCGSWCPSCSSFFVVSDRTYYVSKHIIFTVEPGYGIFRKLRSGVERNKNYVVDYKWNDRLFIKLNASYRIRL
ncbi:MAG TPA: hypothetical protein VEV83_10880 [Parafilimonas sp.]|nr:hypothetical protein [Parafilimonas sp.]